MGRFAAYLSVCPLGTNSPGHLHSPALRSRGEVSDFSSSGATCPFCKEQFLFAARGAQSVRPSKARGSAGSVPFTGSCPHHRFQSVSISVRARPCHRCCPLLSGFASSACSRGWSHKRLVTAASPNVLSRFVSQCVWDWFWGPRFPFDLSFFLPSALVTEYSGV